MGHSTHSVPVPVPVAVPIAVPMMHRVCISSPATSHKQSLLPNHLELAVVRTGRALVQRYGAEDGTLSTEH